MNGDGNGWVFDPDGSRFWGRFGAAGLLVRADDPAAILLQHRAAWSHQGGTWALPGGARDSHETASEAALREAYEEAGLRPGDVEVLREVETARSVAGWTYTTVFARVAERPRLTPNAESTALEWVPVDEVPDLLLHPAFAAAWPSLRALL
ncbi:NUDIX domain-containing protein [Tsukamurella sp. 8F]|uniref:NUDIX hydrolase n=1 Tax=unclassified Tsukamurella TaxID=2633480 RepID=UPI0023B91C81|nr:MULTISPECIES: NUDIX domain-containing protein [unclassified Tsukamurella]MDF0529533.1 NUDIX domain-containing protein [Tsukamurella sp. 8J]MDF0585779.1 NUDIX domain-containing protein [Tsukamurella sp. 8F]